MNGYQIFSELLFSRAQMHGIPLSGTFELTSRCNLDCKMCYIHKRANDTQVQSREWDAQKWLSLAKQCQQAGMLHLLLTGGEPFLRPDFREIYDGCRKLGLLVSINTNATLIDDEMISFLASNPPTRMNITLYGASQETYGNLCGVPSAYDQVVRNILALKKAGILVKLNYSVTQYNRQDFQAVSQFAKEHEIPMQVATYMFPPVRACEQGCFAADRMTPAEAAQAEIAHDLIRYEPEELRQRWQDQLNGLKVENPDSECQEIPAERIKCRAGSSTFWITWDGKMRPCGMMTEPSVDVTPTEFHQAWQAVRKAREEIYIPAKCTACEIAHACDQCPAICFAETGSFTKSPEYMCEKTRIYLELMKENLQKLS